MEVVSPPRDPRHDADDVLSAFPHLFRLLYDPGRDFRFVTGQPGRYSRSSLRASLGEGQETSDSGRIAFERLKARLVLLRSKVSLLERLRERRGWTRSDLRNEDEEVVRSETLPPQSCSNGP
jgi:hypothetical protein